MQTQYSGQLVSTHGSQTYAQAPATGYQAQYAYPQAGAPPPAAQSVTYTQTSAQPVVAYEQPAAYAPPAGYQQAPSTYHAASSHHNQAPSYQQAPSTYQHAPSTHHHAASTHQPAPPAYQVSVPAGYTVHAPTLKGSPIIQGNTITTASTSYVHPHDANDPEVGAKKTLSVAHSVVNVPPESTVQSGTMGTLKPHQKPYAFTTVTYAKQPGVSSSALNESYAAKYAAAQRDGVLEVSAAPKGRRTRFVRKQRGMCGGFNECMGAPYDSNGGRCGLFNIGCCDRGQRVPVDIEYSPETNF